MPDTQVPAPPHGHPLRERTGVERTRVRFWGTRGSIPSPGPTTVRYGGNTSCVEIRVGETLLILDGGTGIRGLGASLRDHGGGIRATILLTHFHWDHIQGLPFFKPFHDPEARLDILAPATDDATVERRLGHQMEPAFFPVPFHRILADCRFGAWTRGEREFGSCRVSAFRARHPSHTVGYRIDTPAGSIGYFPDNELVGGNYDVGSDWRTQLEHVLSGVDVLIHDAMIVGEPYATYEGWGHSTVDQALELARSVGAGHLVGFHHSPVRTDDDLDAEVARIRAQITDHAIEFSLAAEGRDLLLGAPRASD